MKNILLPTDFSINSKNAISYALNFYKDEPCNFILLNTFKVDGFTVNSRLIPFPGNAEIKRKTTEAEKKINMLIKEIQMRYPNSKHNFTGLIKNLNLVPAINEILHSTKIEVIPIGTQGNTDASRVSYGSNTINIMEEVTGCPILAIPSHVKFTEIKEIVLASGFKSTPKPEELSFIKELVVKTKATLRILHVEEDGGLDEDQKKIKNMLKELIKDIPHSFHTLSHVSVAVGIYCFIESRCSDMVTFINKKHSFFQNVLFNPLYKDLGNYSRIPVLIIQTAKRKRNNPLNNNVEADAL